MTDKTTRVYVTDPAGKFIPKYGTRHPGGFFDLPADVATGYANLEGFSLNDPDAPKKSTKKAAPKSEDSES